MIFEKQYLLKNNIDSDLYIENVSILETFTSISKEHTNFLNVKLPCDIVWMVLDWKLRVKNRPKSGGTYTIRTWIVDWNRAYAIRCYDIIDEDGLKYAECISRWALCDMNTRKLFRMSQDIMGSYEKEKGLSELENSSFLKNISNDATLIRIKEVEISNDMIDENNHIHNTVYSTLSELVLPRGSNLDFVDISYRKEIENSKKIILNYCKYQENNLVIIKTDNEESPNAILLYNN